MRNYTDEVESWITVVYTKTVPKVFLSFIKCKLLFESWSLPLLRNVLEKLQPLVNIWLPKVVCSLGCTSGRYSIKMRLKRRPQFLSLGDPSPGLGQGKASPIVLHRIFTPGSSSLTLRKSEQNIILRNFDVSLGKI